MESRPSCMLNMLDNALPTKPQALYPLSCAHSARWARRTPGVLELRLFCGGHWAVIDRTWPGLHSKRCWHFYLQVWLSKMSPGFAKCLLVRVTTYLQITKTKTASKNVLLREEYTNCWSNTKRWALKLYIHITWSKLKYVCVVIS